MGEAWRDEFFMRVFRGSSEDVAHDVHGETSFDSVWSTLRTNEGFNLLWRLTCSTSLAPAGSDLGILMNKDSIPIQTMFGLSCRSKIPDSTGLISSSSSETLPEAGLLQPPFRIEVLSSAPFLQA